MILYLSLNNNTEFSLNVNNNIASNRPTQIYLCKKLTIKYYFQSQD